MCEHAHMQNIHWDLLSNINFPQIFHDLKGITKCGNVYVSLGEFHTLVCTYYYQSFLMDPRYPPEYPTKFHKYLTFSFK